MSLRERQKMETLWVKEYRGAPEINSQESIKNPVELNFLTNFDVTVEIIKGIKGMAWYHSYLSDMQATVQKVINMTEEKL